MERRRAGTVALKVWRVLPFFCFSASSFGRREWEGTREREREGRKERKRLAMGPKEQNVTHWAMQVVRAGALLVSMWLTREWRNKTSGPYRWSSLHSPISSSALRSSTFSSPRRRNDARKHWMVLNKNTISCLTFNIL